MAKPKGSSANGDAEATSFEDSFNRLTEMAEQLEAGGLTLAEATARFEEGMKLVQHCNELLNNAELKITELKEVYLAEGTQGEMNGQDDLEDELDD